MNYRRSVGAVLSTAALIAAMSPVAAFAKTSGTGITDVEDVSVTVSGLTEGDTATAYQVFDAYIDGNNVLQYKAATGLPEAFDSIDELQKADSNSDEAKAAADAYSQAFADGTATGVAGPVTSSLAGADGKATFTGLDSGYWVVVVTSTSGKAKVYQPTTIDVSPAEKDGKWASNTRAALKSNQIKSEPVSVTKGVKGVGDNYEEKTDQYSVGQSVPFKVTTNVPNYPRDSKDATFKITDTPTAGLEIDASSITVKVGNTAVWENGAATNDGAAAFKTDTTKQQATGYTFDFAKEYVLAHPGKTVEITYNAMLTSAAFSRVVANAADVTGNTAQVAFNPNPYSDSTATPDDKTTVQTYGFVFKKVDQDKNALEGAVFTLYDKDGKEVIKDEKGHAITSTSTIVDGNAYVYFEHLGEGDYVAKETTVPAGKTKAQDVNFTLNKGVATNDNPATTGVTENNYLVAKDAIVDGNQPLLPVTGDAGTLFITIGGVALIGAACIVVSRSRKRSE